MAERHSHGWAGSVRRTFPAHIPLYVSSFFFVAAIFAVLEDYAIAPQFHAAWIFLAIFVAFMGLIFFAAVAGELIALLRDGFPANPLKRVTRRLIGRLCAEDRIGNIFHSGATLFPLLVAFTVFKSEITHINPFGWDKSLVALDNVIGLGHQPWRLLQPLLGYEPITIVLSWTYYVWFFALFACLAGEAFSKHCDALRMQFLLAFGFAFFFAGCVLAVILSSAGPCYFGYLHLGSDPYASQIAYLRGIGPNELPSVVVQDALWKAYSKGAFSEGISAMPSMHVTIAMLIGLLGWQKRGGYKLVLPIFALMIVLASVHLAWHYASDSLAGIGLSLLFWYVAGRVVASWNSYLARRRDGVPYTPGTVSGAGMPNDVVASP